MTFFNTSVIFLQVGFTEITLFHYQVDKTSRERFLVPSSPDKTKEICGTFGQWKWHAKMLMQRLQ